MSHPLVVALFSDLSQAAAAARELHAAGVGRDQLSVISRNHDEESNYAAEIGGSPGAEIEDSRTAARFGELSGYFLAAIALVLPGIGPIVAAGRRDMSPEVLRQRCAAPELPQIAPTPSSRLSRVGRFCSPSIPFSRVLLEFATFSTGQVRPQLRRLSGSSEGFGPITSTRGVVAS